MLITVFRTHASTDFETDLATEPNTNCHTQTPADTETSADTEQSSSFSLLTDILTNSETASKTLRTKPLRTITIAAITIGIAIDNSIHYIYRYREYLSATGDPDKTLIKCNETVGVAIKNTSYTIIAGFSILVFSNFYPTIYFGIFTGLAMLLAMISVLTLLPSLILVMRPFGK